MATFPRNESEIISLAQSIISGLRGSAAVYDNPPYTPEFLAEHLTALIDKQNAMTAAVAAAQRATAAKDTTLEDLVNEMKAVLRYAELTVNGDDAQLKLLGWGGKAARTPQVAPGQPRMLEAPRRGEGWLFLDWKEPSEGGKVTAYKVQRRERPSGAWIDIATALYHEATLADQPRMKDLEYRVIAINKAGESEASNTITAIV